MMKKRIAATLALAMLVCAAVSCGNAGGPSSSIPPGGVSSPQAQSQPASVPQPPRQLEPLPLAEGLNALTGQPLAEGAGDGLRPVAVMVSNNSRSLPQRGLAAADVVVEMLAEGGITRLMALYADCNAVPQVGPVRSTRDQFVQLALPLGAIQVHIGTSVYARNLLTVMQEQDVDGLYLGRTAFVFDTERSLPKPGGHLNEYCWFTDAGLIAAGMAHTEIPAAGQVHTLFRFDAEAPEMDGSATDIRVDYSDLSQSGFSYSAETGLYAKTIWGSPHQDEDGAQLSYTNVFLLNCPTTYKPDGLCLEFDMRGSTGWYFTGGQMKRITWQKGAPENPLRLFDEDGEELLVRPGKSYIGFMDESRVSSADWGQYDG